MRIGGFLFVTPGGDPSVVNEGPFTVKILVVLAEDRLPASGTMREELQVKCRAEELSACDPVVQ